MNLNEIKAFEVMVNNIVTIKAQDKITHANLLMIKNNVGGLPVIDKDYFVIGIITQRDINLSRLAIELESNSTIGDLMTKNPITVDKDETLKEILEKMFKYNIERLPVIDEDKKLIGLVLREPILKKVLEFLKEKID